MWVIYVVKNILSRGVQINLCGWEIFLVLLKKKSNFSKQWPVSFFSFSFLFRFCIFLPFHFCSSARTRPPAPAPSSLPARRHLLPLLFFFGRSVEAAAVAAADGAAGQTGGAADLAGVRHFRWLQAVESLVQAWFFCNSFNSLIYLFDFWIFF